MFIAPSSKEIHETAILTSGSIKVRGTGKCLSFWYFMHGENVGSLRVQVEIIGQSTLWQLYVNKSGENFWRFGQVPLISKGRDFTVNTIILYIQYDYMKG